VETWKNLFQGKLNRRHIHTVMERKVKKTIIQDNKDVNHDTGRQTVIPICKLCYAGHKIK
jgi:hypothetical protein